MYGHSAFFILSKRT